jgi:hypothetical protein
VKSHRGSALDYTKLAWVSAGHGNVLYHRVPEMQPALQQSFRANTLQELLTN